MQVVGAAADAALASTGRSFAEQFLVDWNGNGLFDHELSDLSQYLIEYDTDRALTTALATRLQGFTVGELQASLDMYAGELLSPWRSDQPRFRQPRTGYAVKATTFIAGEGIRQFTGILRSISADSGGTVKLVAFDPVDPLYQPVAVPTVTARDAPAPHTLNPGLTAYWVISDALDQVGLPLGPKRLPNARAAASMHGSAAPNLGTLDRAFQFIRGRIVAEPISFGEGQQGTPAMINGPTTGGYRDDVTAVEYVMSAPVPATAVGDEARIVADVWFHSTSNVGQAIELRSVRPGRVAPKIYVHVFRNQIRVEVRRTQGGTAVGTTFFPPEMALAQVWHRVAVDIRFTTLTSAQVRCQVNNGALASASLFVGAAAAGNTHTAVDNANLFQLMSGSDPGTRTTDMLRVQHFQAGVGLIDPDVWAAWAPSADVRTDMAPLAVTPPFSGSAKQLLEALAEAEQAAHGFTEFGRYFYTSRSLWRDYIPLREVTASNALTGLAVEESLERAARTVVVPHYLPGPLIRQVYSLSTALRVPARSTLLMTVTLSDPIIQAQPAVYGFFFDRHSEWTEYAANTRPDGTGVELELTITVTLRGVDADLSIRNRAGFDAYLVGPSHWEDDNVLRRADLAGRPCLIIQGIAAVLGDEVTISREDSSSPSLSIHTAPSSQWRQGYERPRMLMTGLQKELHHPPPTLTGVQIVGDPRLRLGDCIQLADPVTGIDDPCHIVGLRARHSAGSITQTLDVQMVGPPGAWLIGVPGRSEIGVTTYA